MKKKILFQVWQHTLPLLFQDRLVLNFSQTTVMKEEEKTLQVKGLLISHLSPFWLLSEGV